MQMQKEGSKREPIFAGLTGVFGGHFAESFPPQFAHELSSPTSVGNVEFSRGE